MINLRYTKNIINPKKCPNISLERQCHKSDSSKALTKTTPQGLITTMTEAIAKASRTQQLLIGTASGWTTGFLTTKIGKKAAFYAGATVIIYQIAHEKGFIKSDWNEIKNKVEQTTKKIDCQCAQKAPEWIANAKKFGKSNTCFAAGFIGGFLIGLAC